MQLPKLNNRRWVHFDPYRVPASNRIQIVLSLQQLRHDLQDYLKALEPYGYDLQHLVGFSIDALSERYESVAHQMFSHVLHPQPSAFTYLAHEMLSVNPYIGQNQQEYQRIVGTARGAIEIIIGAIRNQLLNATRNPLTSKVLLERYVGNNAVLLSVEVIEAPHGTASSPTAPVL